LVFPGVWSATGFFGAGPQSAVWLWVSWHGGFPLLVLISAVIEAWWTAPAASASTAPSLIMTGCVLGLVILLTVLVTQCQAWLPNLITDGHYLNLTHSVPGILVPLINVAALVAVLLGTRRGPVLDLGLTIAVLASLIDAVLTLRAGARFSLGWYVARAATTVTAFSVLAVYLREITALHARVIRLNRQLAEQAMMDVITGLFNRRHFNTQLDLTLREAARRRVSTSLLLIDIDHFKRYNDQYGHLAGDACLHQVGQAIRRALRRTDDVATRYGGEEFAVILPATGIADATTIAHRILDTVLALRIEHAASQSAAIVTVSIGVGTVPPGTSLEDIIRRADRALYAAKDAGRNQVSAETDVALAG
jgi:diguanylate cyclase (GGDEF)-like protein